MSKIIIIPKNLEKKDLYKFLLENKSALVAQKKDTIKWADAITHPGLFVSATGEITEKADAAIQDTESQITRQLVINTTNLLDSHDDVHIPGLWKKSLQESKGLYLLQEHQMTFAGIVSDNINASTKKLSWKSLGADYSGETEALLFNTIIEQKRNPFMFLQYKDGNVKNHSVGMRYVVIELAINDEDYKAEFATWNKYINQIANKSDAEDNGFFFPVLEAKVVEGSAVVRGSNWITPVLNASNSSKIENTKGKQPGNTTEQPEPFDVMEAIKTHKFIF